MKFWRNKKIVLTALVVMIVVIVALVPKEAHAWGIDYVVSGAIGWITFVANYIIGFIAGIFFALSAFLVQWALGFNELILNNEVVQIGWSITLSFANLGFVLAIIIIAFATIFRMQSYAMKQTLWKLIVAALLVNFSLVIAGAFINVSDIATRSFQNASKLNPLTAADTLGAAFNTQRLIAVSGESCFWYQEDIVIGVFKNSGGMCKKSEEGTTKPGTLGKFRCDCNLKATLQEIKEKTGGNLSGEFLTMIASLFFSVVFSILGIITLLAIFVMLLIRYVALGFILVLSPLAWLCWIFPSTQSLWKKWWDNFLRWTFFAPIMSFFMYLAIKSLESMPMLTDVEVQKILSGTFNQPGFLENVSSMLILIGFMLGGLYVANSLSITGASTAMGIAKGAGKWAGGAVGRKGLQWGTSPLRAKWGKPGEEKSLADRISGWSAKSKLAKYTILPGLVARGIAKFSAAGGENLVSQTKAAASKRSLNENIAMLGYADAPTRHGILQHLQEKDLLDKVPDGIKYIDNKYKTEAVRFGQGVGYNNIEKSLGMSVEMKEAFNEFGKDSKEFSEAGKTFFSKFSEKDWTKPQYNEMYKTKSTHGTSQELHNARQQVFAQALGEINPGQLAKTMPKIKGENFDNYENVVKKAIKNMEEMAYEVDKTDSKKAEKIYVKAANIEDSFKKALGRRTLGIEWESTEFAESAKPTESKEEKKS